MSNMILTKLFYITNHEALEKQF